MSSNRLALVLSCWLLCGPGGTAAQGQVSRFDAASGLVSLPSVSVGAATYAPVTLRHEGNLVFRVQSATPQQPAAPGVARYDAATGRLTIPAVRVGADTFVDVALRDEGGLVFTLAAATPLPAALAAEIDAFLAAFDAHWAQAVPDTGARATAFNDGCYLHNGRSSAYIAATIDADPQAQRDEEAYQVGARRTNVQVLALRQLRNADGSERREVDLQYDITYRDGSVRPANPHTLISGSSAGTPGCSTPTVGAALRFFGNQRLVGITLRPRNQRDERYAMSNGAALSPAVQLRRDIRFQVSDPLGHARYVVISGPGPSVSNGGQTHPFSLKMVSPQLLRSAPELAGRSGHFVNWADDDGFRACSVSGGGVPVASLADCTGLGASTDNVGVTTATPGADADASFAAQGWRAGGVYRVDVHADDGWKTVNGHTRHTPLATYHVRLERLPYTFVEMAAGGLYPQFNLGSLSAAALRSQALAAAPAPVVLQWSAPSSLPDGRVFRLSQTWHFLQGPKLGNPAGASWPQLRQTLGVFPGPLATSANWPLQPRLADMAQPTYMEFMIFGSLRDDAVIQSRLSFQ